MRVQIRSAVVASAVLMAALVLQFCHADPAHAQGALGVASGVCAIGMGNAGSVVDDPWAGTLNPGALAPNMIGISVMTAHTTDGDLSFDRINRNTLVGLAMPLARLGISENSLGLGMAYAHRDQRAGIKNINYTDGTTHDFIDEMEYHTLSIIADYGVQLGAGVTQFTYYNSVSEQRSAGRDYGVVVSVPVFHIASMLSDFGQRTQLGKFTPEFVLTSGYTWSNRSPYGEELFEYHIFGLSAVASLHYRQFELLHVTFARDMFEKRLPSRTLELMGWEFGYFDILNLRLGMNPNTVTESVYGIGLHARGIAKLIFALSNGFDHDRLPWYTTGIDLYYQYAHADLFGNPSHHSEFGFVIDGGALMNR